MRAERIPVGDLSDVHWQAWERFRSAGSWLDGPFFAPEFFRALAEERPRTEVAVLSGPDGITGFLPLEAARANSVPAAADICEISGCVAADELDWTPVSTLPQVGLRSWSFDCVPVAQKALQSFHLAGRDYWQISLPNGFEAYCRQLAERGSQQLAQNRRKSRRLESEHGPLRFIWNSDEPAWLDNLIRLKREQYRRTGALDVLSPAWVPRLLERMRRVSGERFAAVCSSLFAGERLVAVAYCLRSQHVLAWWFPAYDPAFAGYSPGTMLLLRMVEEAAGRGITRIELGQGDERYKLSFANDSFPVAEGVADRRVWRRAWHATWCRTRDWATSQTYCRLPLRFFRLMRSQMRQRYSG